MSYEHSFMKKHDVINSAHEVEFRSVFRASSRKFKILTIPNVLSHRKSYEHGFVKKCDGHKLYGMSSVKSSFDQFCMHRLKNLKY
ncbi:hypothetical protein B296_00010891 [Ensete ventricosum]|uniref:Uncharacterized protein n=1 Tax=Ensete ventricosum TaxID=4639 RepID=A0A426XT75_ENSVE|nr:hypothetical protein B296_00010891 [Ensete ventricosum]